jgi:hypothetical protein
MGALDEVVRQHVFIEGWLAGTVDRGGDGWRTFADVLDDGFVIVPPSGVAEPKAQLLERFEPAYGAAPGVRLEIRNGTLVHSSAEIEVVRYEEWQIHETRGNQRVSTAVFAADEATPLGWRWLTLHETALPAGP